MGSFVPKTGAAVTDAVARTLLRRGIQVLALGAVGQEDRGVLGRMVVENSATPDARDDRTG